MDSITTVTAESSFPKKEQLDESLSNPLIATPLSSFQGPCGVNVHYESMPNDVDRHQLAVNGGESGEIQAMQLNSGQMKLSLPNKRKALTELSPDAEGAQKMSLHNKRVADTRSFVNVCATSASVTNSSRSIESGRMVIPAEFSENRSQSTGTKTNAIMQESPKPQNEYVRVKLKESLASALALVSNSQDCCADAKVVIKTDSTTLSQEGVVERTADLNSRYDEACNGRDPSPTRKSNDVRNESETKDMCEEATRMSNSIGSSFLVNPVSSGENASFSNVLVSRDEVFKGNELLLVSDSNSHIPEMKQVENTDKPVLRHDSMSSHKKEQTVQSPELVALKIESELYKFFGGVNKKYKEKGRSLLFNLKDRNNPDLREKVMSGEIPPDRLCSMTAEELASKELSQWRIAKAEELDQMKVLPDSEVSMRRLVKKTHKGEYQVDFDPDVGAPEEIPLATSVPIYNRPKMNDIAATRAFRDGKTEADQDSENTTSGGGADIQEHDPLVVSVNEFKGSLDKEPPFEKTAVDCRKTTELVNRTSGLDFKANPPIQPLKPYMVMTSQKNTEVGVESTKPLNGVKSSDGKVDTLVAVSLPKGEQVWEGVLQLDFSSMAPFRALYKSGQKACTREWPNLFEIKGRVKLDAFEKFVDKLPMSRSRAIMVLHFVLKEDSTDHEHTNLIEVVDSYNVDQRLGFAEPYPGVELYLCPPHSRTVDVLINHLSRTYTEKLNDIDNGLIGIVVWRKVQITQSANSPNFSSHNKNMAEKSYFTSRAQNTKNFNRNVSFSAPRPASLAPNSSIPMNDDDDDPPPGFGPPCPQNDDDLPEFGFSGGPNPLISQNSDSDSVRRGLTSRKFHSQAPSGQVEQMRELIKKYGQNETKPDSGIPMEPWNDDDDDDDIPEWQPQSQSQPQVLCPEPQTHVPHHEPLPGSQMPHHEPQPHVTHYEPPQPQIPYQEPPPQPPLPSHHLVLPPHMPTFQQPPWPLQPLQPPMSVNNQGIQWPYDPNSVGNQPSSGQLQGTLGLDMNPLNNSNYWGY